MDAPRSMRILFLAAIFLTTVAGSKHNVPKTQNVEPQEKVQDKTLVEDNKLEVFDGVSVSFPKDNSTGRLMSLEFDTNKGVSEGRGKKKGLMQRILPMFILPFIIQSAIMPLIMGMLKFMLIKSFLVGKLALTLIMINAFKNHNSFKGRDAEMASVHYGYHGDNSEHLTSYFN